MKRLKCNSIWTSPKVGEPKHHCNIEYDWNNSQLMENGQWCGYCGRLSLIGCSVIYCILTLLKQLYHAKWYVALIKSPCKLLIFLIRLLPSNKPRCQISIDNKPLGPESRTFGNFQNFDQFFRQNWQKKEKMWNPQISLKLYQGYSFCSNWLKFWHESFGWFTRA